MPSHHGYSLQEVLAVARIHPFYSDVEYPPDRNTVETVTKQAATSYNVIERLVKDHSRDNTYRRSVYTSVTGGGSGSQTLFFATDVLENRVHRANFGRLLRNTGVIKDDDWVLSTHWGGHLYRSLDLTCEILENAGASVLAAGITMPLTKVIHNLQDFRVNVLAGDSSQIISIVQYISTLPSSERYKIKLNKIIYTSESLTAAQRKHVHTILGCVKICSMVGSSEAGPYGVSNPDLTEVDPSADCTDFIFDTRMNIFEILPLSCTQMSGLAPLSDGEKGMIAQTSLARLRNPLVRYMTGDIGSLHPLSAKAHAHIPKDEWPYMRVLRLYGRDCRFSFDWDGGYFDFRVLGEIMQQDDLGILQWQIILDRMESSPESLLEIRLLCCQDPIYREAAIVQLRYFFDVTGGNEHRFRVVFVEGLDGFKLSETGRKVVKFINRFD
ncbi:hypothetical protein KAF25_002189 [Fusarium avenaceum]|uniref:AMP-dependent synthetase/ligase domain-containing protein n=1 Tax=Fusarium avenaceum TaxID=40199 RepID=A0A9P7H224_9HYPO|nr:hypothetical protein KAF25_002189 [Fusarium avenaceum]